LLTAVASAHAADITASDTQQIHNLFLRQAAAESAHDIHAMDDLLAHAAPSQPDPVSFIARAYQFWGREAVLEHFRKTFAGTWHFDPDENAIRIVPLNGDAAQIYAPTRITIGAAGQPAKTARFLINEFAIRTQTGWKIASIVPVPAE
jgi:ketosteroid isomerase-like protein